MSVLPRVTIATLNSLSLEGSGLSRDAPVPQAQRPEGFDAAFDDTTLWYDAVHLGGRLQLVMPRLFNLGPVLNDASLTLDGAAVRLAGIRRHRRHEIARVDLPAGTRIGPDSRLGLSIGRWQGDSGISADQGALFAGLNASVHISRNNDLRWIADWARFHISAHGLQGMVVMDNASDAYPAEAIADALEPLPLKRIVVLKVPQPYGPPRSKSHAGTAKFLQPAMLNLARLRFLGQARAVLHADIDELVWTKGPSVFDAAAASTLGYVSYKGRWRMPPPETRRTAPPIHVHSDHVLKRREAEDCPTKYCVVPGGWLGRLSWDVHRLEWGLLPSRRLHPDLGYWHCQAVTTNWKVHDRLKARAPGPEDPETVAALSRHLG